ncbi:retrovirus polyprotein [Cordyceps javanica]|uniref:Retrovirus polyprotein n=1 Tax=Cordyceps javanica TaxID=43265 RepID=A0A545VJN2_9HYPO|nr:retrovirus polyprotein [Cordyceps javanica]TQW01880.1 retrovirus polyprotein [Cordyceps javanica]
MSRRVTLRNDPLHANEMRIPVDPLLMEDEPSDNEEYEPSNEDGRASQTEAEVAPTSGSETIDAFNYVRRDHPERPLRKPCTLSGPSQLYSLKNHRHFWWDVLVAMNKRAQTNMDQDADQTIRDEVIRLAEEVRELRRENDRLAADKTFAERKGDELEKKLELAQKGRERDQAIIAHLGSQPRAARVQSHTDEDPARPQRRNEFTSVREETTGRTASRFPSANLELHNNPKFPDAPVFSGDRRAFEAWKDKIRDKLDNSAAQYPTEQQRIQYIRSRTEGSAYEQIRAQSRPEHPRYFLTAEEMLLALEKVYGDRNKRTRAMNELRTLRMGRKTFDDFYADFARCAAEIGYADDAMIPLLENAISDDLSRQDIEKALAPKTNLDPKAKLPIEYHEFLDVFSRKEADKLPPHRLYDHSVQLKEGAEPPFGPLYDMSRDELLVLREYLEENLGKGFIRASRSPAASPVLFVRKPGGGLRFCVDYRALNALTVKNRYPIPLIRETLDRLCRARYYTKLDIIAAFNRLRIAKGDEWMTAFRTRYGLFEYLVMPFGLTNGPASFQHFVNDALREYLDIFCTAYLDDILIYSNNLKEHKKHVKQVLQRLREFGLQADIAKCEFHVQEVKYLGLIVGTEGIRMDPAKVSAVVHWPTPKNVKDVQSFLGFANFYRRFIRDFASKANPLTRLTKKDTSFMWNTDCEKAFADLKQAFTSAPILRHFDPDKPSTVECDSSDYVNAGCLSQPDDAGILHPVAFFSRRLIPAECNYDIYDKELMAIVRAFEEWRAELEGAGMPVQVISDHKNLQHFMTTKRLSRRQARWSEFLSRFNFQLIYRPGKQGGKPDALTRRSSDLPQDERDERQKHQNQVILKPDNLSPGMLPISVNQAGLDIRRQEIEKSIEELISSAYENDAVSSKILEALRKEDGFDPPELKKTKVSRSILSEMNQRLYIRNRLYVPEDRKLRLHLLRESHDSAVAGHPGRAKTYEILSRHYYWPKMSRHVKRYDDWANWLPLAEFAINNHRSETTGVSPFYAVYGQHPRSGIEPPTGVRKLPQKQRLDVAAADKFAEWMTKLTTNLREEMDMAQSQHAEQANRSRSSAPTYKHGDKVWLDTRNLRIDRPSKKLSDKYIGPYEISEVISPATVRLDLPPSMKIHNVFHTNLLRSAEADPLPGRDQQVQPRVKLVQDMGSREWMMEEILSSRITKNRYGDVRLEYLVKWKGSPPTWRPQRDLIPGSEALLYTFHDQCPEKPSPSDLWRRRSS